MTDDSNEQYYELKCGASFRKLYQFHENLDRYFGITEEAISQCLHGLGLSASVKPDESNGTRDRFAINIPSLGIHIAVTHSCISLGIVGDEHRVIKSDILLKLANCMIDELGVAIWGRGYGRLGAEYAWILPVDVDLFNRLVKVIEGFKKTIHPDSVVGENPTQFLASLRYEGDNDELIQIRVRISRDMESLKRYLILHVDSQVDFHKNLIMANHFAKAKNRFCKQLENLKKDMLEYTQDELVISGAEQ